MRGRHSATMRFAAACAMSVGALISVDGQSSPLEERLRAGIERVKAGDFQAAVATLDDVATRASLDESNLIARAYLYKAEAFLRLNEPDYARTSVVLALDADPRISVESLTLSAVTIALVDEVRAGAAADPESAGKSAEASGRFDEAFTAYMRAFRGLPDPPPVADERRLRERIITVVRRLTPRPDIPQEARTHYTKALQLMDAEKILGTAGAATSEAVATELRRAIRHAPWWGEPTFTLAVVLQGQQRVDDAFANLDFYRLADPEGYAAVIAGKSTPAPATKEPPRAVPTPVVVAPQTASIYVYWPPQSRGGGRQKVYCDGFHVADLEKSRFIVLDVKPGAHDIRFRDTTETVAVEAGGKYYMRTSAEGFPVRPVMRVVTAEEGAAEMRADGVTSNDPRRTYATECTAAAINRRR